MWGDKKSGTFTPEDWKTLMRKMSVGSSVHADNSKTTEMFDWKPIPFEKSILESAAVVKTLLN